MDDTNKLSEEARRAQAIRMAADALSHAYVRAAEPEDRMMYRSAGLLLDMLFPAKTDTPPVALPAVVDAGARDLHLDIVEQGFTALLDSLMPSFEYVGVALRVSAEDHAAIRSAMAGARTSMRLLKNARAALAAHPAPASASASGASESLQAMADNERELGLGYETGASEEQLRKLLAEVLLFFHDCSDSIRCIDRVVDLEERIGDYLTAPQTLVHADVERYRKLRANSWRGGDETLVVVRVRSLRLGAQTYSGHLLDEAIDAARLLSTDAEGGSDGSR